MKNGTLMEPPAHGLDPDEVISPELALVDPELARRARLALPDRPPWSPPLRPIPTASVLPAPQPAHEAPAPAVRLDPRRPARAFSVLGAAIPVFAVGAVLVGLVTSEVRAQLQSDPAALPVATPAVATLPAPVAPARVAPARAAPAPVVPAKVVAAPVVPRKVTPAPKAPVPEPSDVVEPGKSTPAAATAPKTTPEPAPAPEPKPAPPARAEPAPAPPKPRPTGRESAEREAEHLLLVYLRQQWRGDIPPAWIDGRTGLLVDDLVISCSRVRETRQFDCSVGVGRAHAEEWLLTVEVARDGRIRPSWRGRSATG